jgi:hypothetical protein
MDEDRRVDSFEYNEVYGDSRVESQIPSDYSPIQSLGYNELRQSTILETPRKHLSKAVSSPPSTMNNRGLTSDGKR